MSKRAQVGRGGVALLCFGLLSSCANEPEEPVERRPRGSTGEEVFRVFCKRAATAAFPEDLEGTQFNAACEGKGESPRSNPHFDALLARRTVLVEALDIALGGDPALAKELVPAPFMEDELHDFMGSLVPLYDPPALAPSTTRSIAQVPGRLLDDKDATGKKALDVLARTTGRKGYRPLSQALGVIRPVLEYPHLDDFVASSIALTAKGGKAEKEFDALIHALSLELATYDPTPLAPDSTLTLARNLLLSDLWEHIPEERPAADPLLLVKRDGRGVAVPFKSGEPFTDLDGDTQPDIDGFGRLRLSDGKALAPAPFKVRGERNVERDNYDAALNTWSEETDESGQKLPLFSNIDIDKTMLAGMAREQTRLLVTKQPGDRTTVDKLTRGMPALLGKTVKRKLKYGKADIEWDGPDLASAPIAQLVHAVGTVVAKPEFAKVLAVLEDQLKNHEAESAELIDVLLRIDARADAHPEAVIIGANGEPGGPSQFWDDMIAIGERMTVPERRGLIEDLMRSLLDTDEPGDEPPLPNKANGVPDETNPPCAGVCAPAQGVMLANWMRYRDHVVYPGTDINATARSQMACEGKPYCDPVDYTQRDVGWNRSIFQRVLAMVHSLNGQSQCNKDGAKLKGDVLGADWPLLPGDTYAPCELFNVPDMVEVHILATLNKSQIKILDGQLKTLSNVGCLVAGLGCLGVTQEEKSGIKGFDDTPSPESLARFVFAFGAHTDPAKNEFITNMSGPALTLDGVEIDKWEADALFPMEVVDPDAKPLDQPNHPGLNFLQAGRSLMKAFEEHEIRGNPGPEDKVGPLIDAKGYLFGDLMSTLHMHWAARSEEPCNGPPQETCTQSFDPSAPFYSHQSNLRSYEPLIAEIMGEERLLEVLYRSTKALSETKIGSEDGITIMASFVELLLRPDPALAYRDGRATARTNLGEDVGYVSPMYLLLDGLKAIDDSFATDEHKARLATWKEARSQLIDALMTIEMGEDGKLRMEDRIGRAVSLKVLRFLQDRIAAHRDAGDLEEWAATLDDRLVEQLDRPLIGAALKFMDRAWEDEKAGAELARLTKYLVEEGPGLSASLLAAGDLLQLLDDAVSIAPLLDLVAEAVAPGVTDSVDVSGKPFSAADGIARRATEMQHAVSLIDTKRPSTTAKLMRNLVSDSMSDGSTPLEVILDVIAEVERADPSVPAEQPLDRKDLVSVLGTVHKFLSDEEHGLERLYNVIVNRKLDPGE
jgi:hypothetical protein